MTLHSVPLKDSESNSWCFVESGLKASGPKLHPYRLKRISFIVLHHSCMSPAKLSMPEMLHPACNGGHFRNIQCGNSSLPGTNYLHGIPSFSSSRIQMLLIYWARRISYRYVHSHLCCLTWVQIFLGPAINCHPGVLSFLHENRHFRIFCQL